MNLDQHIKNKFNEQSFEFKEEYWNAASALIDQHKQKKKRRIILWWFFSSSFVAIIALIWFLYPAQNIKEQSSTLLTHDVTVDVPASGTNESLEVIEKTNQSLASTSKEDVAVENKVDNITSTDPHDVTLANAPTSKTKTSLKNNVTKPVNDNRVVENNKSTHGDRQKSVVSSNQKMPAAPIVVKTDDQQAQAEGMVAELPEAKKDISSPQEKIATLKIPLLGAQKSRVPQSSLKTKEDKKPSFFLPYFSVGAYVGIQSSQKNIQFNALFDQVLQQKKQQEENALTSNNIGLDVLFHPTPNWSIASGLEYNTFVEQINYSGFEKQDFETLDNSYYDVHDSTFWSAGWVSINGNHVFFQNANLTTTRDTTFVEQIDTSYFSYTDDKAKTLNGKNTISYLEVPLLIGYQIPYKMIELQLQTGLSMGFLSKHNVRYIADAEDVQNQANIKVNNTVSNLLVKFSLLYHTSRSTQVYLQPAYKQQLTNSVEADNKFSQRYRSYHINIGFRYLFR